MRLPAVTNFMNTKWIYLTEKNSRKNENKINYVPQHPLKVLKANFAQKIAILQFSF